MIDILKIVLPAILVLLTAYLLLNKMLSNEENRRNIKLKSKVADQTIKIQLQAYERLALVLERTTPNILILNTVNSDMNCIDLQKELLNNIRNEFSHNLSQQIYVSDELWSAVKVVQETLLKLVISCSAQFPPTNPATDLAEQMIQVYASANQTPTEYAMTILKNEVRRLI
ncbi:MAG: hypothetical protein Q7U47_03360 [Paludibacter sp.]|nr:hypothetical protein [Paludibacter sp.]